MYHSHKWHMHLYLCIDSLKKPNDALTLASKNIKYSIKGDFEA